MLPCCFSWWDFPASSLSVLFCSFKDEIQAPEKHEVLPIGVWPTIPVRGALPHPTTHTGVLTLSPAFSLYLWLPIMTSGSFLLRHILSFLSIIIGHLFLIEQYLSAAEVRNIFYFTFPGLSLIEQKRVSKAHLCLSLYKASRYKYAKDRAHNNRVMISLVFKYLVALLLSALIFNTYNIKKIPVEPVTKTGPQALQGSELCMEAYVQIIDSLCLRDEGRN